jgi:hypothetical protein
MPYNPQLSAYPVGLLGMGARYASGDLKGSGYFGALPNASGGISTELSGESDGIGEYPLMQPSMTQQQLARLLAGDKNMDDIYQSAEQWALQRQKNGQSPFAQQNELRATPGMLEPQLQYK